MNQRKKGVILSYIYIVVKLIVGLLYVPVLLNYLDDSEYGLYQLMGSLVSYLAVMDFGLSATTVRYYSMAYVKNNKEEAENVLGTANRLYLLISIITLVICIGILLMIDSIFSASLTSKELSEAKKIFLVLSINIVITLLTNVYIAVLNSHERFVFLKMVDIFNTISQIVFVFVAMRISRTALSVVIMLLIINIISSLGKIVYCKLKLKIRVKFHYYDKRLVKSMLTFSTSVFVVSIVDMIYWKTDQIILGMVAGTGAVAIYGVASQIYWNYMPLSTAIQGVFFPIVTKRIAEGANDKELSNYFIKIGRIQYLILGCVLNAFVLIGKEFVIILAGNNYVEAYWICLIIMFPFTIDLIENMGLNIMQAKNKYSFRAIVYSISAVLNIIMSFLLAPKYGGIGCAVASAVCMLICNGVIMNIYYYKVMNIDVVLFWKNIGVASLFNILIFAICKVTFSFMNFNNIYLDFIIKGIIYLSIYAYIAFSFIMNDYEKKVIIKMFGKVKELIHD